MTTKLVYELTAEPIHGDGSSGFDGRSQLFLAAGSLAEVFALMGSVDGDDRDVGIGAYADEFDTWQLTLTRRRIVFGVSESDVD